MVFSDTTNKNGIIQRIEDWTGLGDGAISGDATTLKIFTAKCNDAFDELMPYLLAYLKNLGFDDPNNTGVPVKTADIVSGTSVYNVTTDGTNDILVIFEVAILQSATATQYYPLDKGDLSEYPQGISPNSIATGIPSKVYINGKRIFFNVTPNYNSTNGIKYFFNREQYRFTSSDTTKEPGFLVPFHPLIPQIVAHEWLSINKPSNTTAITRWEKKIADGKAALKMFVDAQNPASHTMTPSITPYI